MNAESAGETETPKRRGRIPQSAWPHIVERHRAGVTLSAIAREFDCTPSAISYIVRKAEAMGVEPAAADDEDNGSSPPAPSRDMVPASTAPEPVAIPAAVMSAPPSPVVAAEAPSVPPTADPIPVRSLGGDRGLSRPIGSDPIRSLGSGLMPRPDTVPGPRNDIPSARPEAGAVRPDLSRPPVSLRPHGTPTTTLSMPVPPPAPPPVPAAVEPPAEAGRASPFPGAGEPRAEARPSQGAPPVDAVEARLRDTARSCLVAYRGWRQIQGEQSLQALGEAVHELRKALARIEIDMSANRRDEQARSPIPIPAHRAQRKGR